MRVVFRTDASLQIGTGHVMRCLTLADALRARGGACLFICREHPGHLIQQIESRGFTVHRLPIESRDPRPTSSMSAPDLDADALAHADWLGASQEADAIECAPILEHWPSDWLVVDHYALNARWERVQRPYCRKLMVIDDLADRLHDCDLLLDQNLGRRPGDYAGKVPTDCQILAGPKYALLRPEFAALRAFSLSRRAQPRLQQLLISMGGVDKDNATGRILDTLKACPLPADCRIRVIMGATAPWLDTVRGVAMSMPWKTDVLVDVVNMAELMADSDLAIGAAGSTSWERCCLGLPTLMLVLADNQRQVAQLLEEVGAARVCHHPPDISDHLQRLASSQKDLAAMSQAATRITDGDGPNAVIKALESARVPIDSPLNRIRLMTRDDLDIVRLWRNHETVRRYMFTRHEISPDEHVRWFENVSADNNRHLLIFERNGIALGFVNLHQVTSDGIAEWGFYVSPSAPPGTGWHLGETVLNYAFAELRLRKICGQALSENSRSIRFHEKLGFHREGLLRAQHFDGQSYHDVHKFGLLASDWSNNH